jgi:hypothetical protein
VLEEKKKLYNGEIVGMFFYEPHKRDIGEEELPEREKRLFFYIIVGGALLASTVGLLAVILG